LILNRIFKNMSRGSSLAPLLQSLFLFKKITDVVASNLMVPHPGKVKPAWQPDLSTSSNKSILIRILGDVGIIGIVDSGYAVLG
jgi:hypothetical protein